jgi:excinuclease UvrABC ATPase subunit
MEYSWPGDFPWDSLLDEELLEPFHPSLLGLESQLPSCPPSWLDDELSFYETSTCFEDHGEDLAKSLQVDIFYEIYNSGSIEYPVIATASHPRTSSPLATDSQQKHFTNCLYEFEGAPSRISRRKRKRYSPVRRKEVDQLRKVGACIRCRLTKLPASCH